MLPVIKAGTYALLTDKVSRFRFSLGYISYKTDCYLITEGKKNFKDGAEVGIS